MKNLLFALMALASFTGIAQSSKIQASELPQKAREFLSAHYKYRPFDSIKKIAASPVPYVVKLAQGTAITFAENGEWCEVDANGASLPKTMLPESIANYLDANFPKKRIVSIERSANGFEVGLKGNIGLAFDAKGKPLQKS